MIILQLLLILKYSTISVSEQSCWVHLEVWALYQTMTSMRERERERERWKISFLN